MLREKSLDSVKIISIDYNLLIRKLEEIAKDIREKVSNVKEILLFGSYAKGNFTPLSDLDILIITKEAELPFLYRHEKFYEFFKEIPLDVNIIVYTQEEIKKLLDSDNMFIKEILSYARKL